MKIECVLGDITRQPDIEAIVNSANASLMPGSGVCGAIHRAAGPELAVSCKPMAPLTLGGAVITPGFKLPNRYVIHAKGPNCLIDAEPERWLAVTVQNCLRLADQHEITSIAFPAISVGIYMCPIEVAAKVMIDTAREEAPTLKHVKRMRWVLASPEIHKIFLLRRIETEPMRTGQETIYEGVSGSELMDILKSVLGDVSATGVPRWAASDDPELFEAIAVMREFFVEQAGEGFTAFGIGSSYIRHIPRWLDMIYDVERRYPVFPADCQERRAFDLIDRRIRAVIDQRLEQP